MQIRYIARGLRNIFNSYLGQTYYIVPRLLLNYFWAFFKVSSNVPKFVELQLEPSLNCNLNCEMCNLGQIKIKEKRGFLTRNNFKKFIDELLPLRMINFTGMGESLLNPHFEEFIAEAKKNGVRCIFITNGQLLTVARAKTIITSGVDQISISMESGDPSTYEKIRKGALFSRLEKNVATLNQIKKEFNPNLGVSINVVLLKHNLEDLTHIFKIIDFAYGYNILEITFQNAHDIYTYQTSVFFTKKRDYLIKALGRIEKYAERRKITTYLPATEIKEGSCYYPWVYPQITATGEVLPCCIISQFGDYSDLSKKYSFGNVFTEDFSKVWNSKKAIAFRKSLSEKKPNEYCRRCSKYLGIL